MRMISSVHRLARAGQWLLRVVTMLAVCAVFLLPFGWVLSGSLREPGLPPPLGIDWLPQPLAWSNYRHIFEIVPLGRYLLNSLVVIGVAVPVTLVTASWAGFAMAQLNERGRRLLLVLSVVLLMVPASALWLPRYVLFTWLGLIDTLWALIVPALMGSSPLFVLLFYWTFRRVPQDLWAAAQLDGADTVRIWGSIAMPLARPTTIIVGVLTVILYWSDYVSPLLFLKSEDRYTLPVGLQFLQQMDRTNWPLLMAASVLMIVPMVLLFLLVQHFFWPEGRREGVHGQ